MEQYINMNSDMDNNVNPQVQFVEFRNIMMPMGTIQNFQNDYNNTNVKVELMDENPKLLDESYEQNVIQNTVDTVSKVHDIEIKDNSIIKNDEGKYIYKQEIPMTSNINNIATKLFSEIRQIGEFSHITIEDIRNLIFKRNIREWNPSIIKGFVKELRVFSNQKSIFIKNVHATQNPQTQTQTQTQNKTQTQIQNNNNKNIVNLNNSFQNLQNKVNESFKFTNHPNHSNTYMNNQLQTQNISFQKERFENHYNESSMNSKNTQILTKTTTMTICSDDRNKELYPSAYDFKMVFENKNDNIEKIKGTIYQNMEIISNITKIQVSSVIIPSSPQLDFLPYLLLEIEEFGGNGTGSNKWFNNCLGKLFFSQKLGKFNIHTEKIASIDKQFNTPINLNSITIKIRKPNGEIWENDVDLSLTVELKITTEKHKISQLSIN